MFKPFMVERRLAVVKTAGINAYIFKWLYCHALIKYIINEIGSNNMYVSA